MKVYTTPDHRSLIWLIILVTILYRRLNVWMTHWTPFSHLSFLTAMAMRPQITWAHAQTVLILVRANVQSSQTSRPSFFDYWKGSHEILSFRSCTYICGSTGSWCAVTSNHLYDQHVVKKCGLDIANKNFRPVSNLPYVSKLSKRAAADQLIDQRSAPWATVGLQETS